MPNYHASLQETTHLVVASTGRVSLYLNVAPVLLLHVSALFALQECASATDRHSQLQGYASAHLFHWSSSWQYCVELVYLPGLYPVQRRYAPVGGQSRDSVVDSMPRRSLVTKLYSSEAEQPVRALPAL